MATTVRQPAPAATAAPAAIVVRPSSSLNRPARTPTLLRVAAAAIAVVAAITIAITTVGRTAAVGRLADSTAAVGTAAGDAAAGFAQAAAEAATLAVAPDDATELRYLQGLATGTNELERAARLTRLGEAAEAPIRRALRSIEAYAADVTRAQDAAAAGTTDAPAAQRARATMTNLIRANTERAGAVHDLAVRVDAGALRDGRVATALVTVIPLVPLVLLLVALQVLLARRFRRLVNVPLVLATVLAFAITVRTGDLQQRQSNRVAEAVSGPYATSQLLTDARVRAFEADGGRRSTDATTPAADAALSAAVSAAAQGSPDHAAALTAALQGYREARTRGAADTGQPGGPTSRFNVLDAELLTARADAGDAFASTVDAARSGQTAHAWLAPVALALVTGLAALGLQRRLAEYR